MAKFKSLIPSCAYLHLGAMGIERNNAIFQ